MLSYISNLLPRLRNYSKELDVIESFVDKKWQLIDNNGSKNNLRFLRDGRLIAMGIFDNDTKQETQEWKWELLSTSELLITKKPGSLLLLEKGFIGDALLVLLESGTNNQPFSCYDPKLIPDGDIQAYLNKFLQVKEATRKPKNAEVDYMGRQIRRNPNGSLFNGLVANPENEIETILFEEGVEVDRFLYQKYITDKGELFIHQRVSLSPDVGNEVFDSEKNPSIDGKYIFEKNDYGVKEIVVANGKIERLIDDGRIIIRVLLVLFVALILFIYYNVKKYN